MMWVLVGWLSALSVYVFARVGMWIAYGRARDQEHVREHWARLDREIQKIGAPIKVPVLPVTEFIGGALGGPALGAALAGYLAAEDLKEHRQRWLKEHYLVVGASTSLYTLGDHRK